MKLIGVISLFTGWFGAAMVTQAVGGFVGYALGIALCLCVAAAHHDGITTGRLRSPAQ
jgi:amino acid transporter